MKLLRCLTLPFFAAKLALVNICFLVKVIAAKISHLKLLLVVAFLLVVQALIYYSYYQSISSAQDFPDEKNSLPEEYFDLKKTPVYQVANDSRSLQQELEKYQQLHQQQPTHQDILLNLGIIESYLNQNPQQLDRYYQEAKNYQPNRTIFRR